MGRKESSQGFPTVSGAVLPEGPATKVPRVTGAGGRRPLFSRFVTTVRGGLASRGYKLPALVCWGV